MLEDDYLLRMVRQLAAVIARVAGLNDRAEYDRALRAADDAWRDLMDGPAEPPGGLDSGVLASLLRDPARIRLAHQILRERARALAGRGDARSAAEQARRSLELLLEARAREPAAPPASGDPDASVLRELRAMVPRDAVATRYHRLLAPDGT